MNEKIKLTGINTIQHDDPYQKNVGGKSFTALRLDPEKRTVEVFQDYNDGNTPADVWHNRVLYTRLEDLDASSLEQYITEDPENLMQTICDNHSVEWDGNNMIGRMTETGHDAWERLVAQINALPESDLVYMSVEEWYSDTSEITADTTDEEIDEYAQLAIDNLGERDVLDGDKGDIIAYLTKIRDELRDNEDF